MIQINMIIYDFYLFVNGGDDDWHHLSGMVLIKNDVKIND